MYVFINFHQELNLPFIPVSNIRLISSHICGLHDIPCEVVHKAPNLRTPSLNLLHRYKTNRAY